MSSTPLPPALARLLEAAEQLRGLGRKAFRATPKARKNDAAWLLRHAKRYAQITDQLDNLTQALTERAAPALREAWAAGIDYGTADREITNLIVTAGKSAKLAALYLMAWLKGEEEKAVQLRGDFGSLPWLDHVAAITHLGLGIKELSLQAEVGTGVLVERAVPSIHSLEVCPGAIKYGGTTVELSGKPLACIAALLDAHEHRLNWRKLQERVWGIDVYTEKGTIKNTIADARDALRKLARLSGKSIDKHFDPLLCVERGKDLAWKLNFPE